MKQFYTGALCLAVILSISIAAAPSAFAAAPPTSTPKETTIKATASVPQKLSIAYYTVQVNGQDLDLDGTNIYTKGTTILVPLRKSAEALGFTLTWNPTTKSTDLDNGTIKTSITVGSNSYAYTSSKAIGMSAPTTLGSAPMIIGGNTYIPVTLYNILYNDPGSIQITDTSLNIKSPSVATKASTVTAATKPDL